MVITSGKQSLPELISLEPATGAEVWRGSTSNVDYEIEIARAAWPAWAAEPVAHRIERVRNFANRVRLDFEKFADLIARETGKPLWEARNEVELLVGKIDISVRAYADRTGQLKHEGKSGTRTSFATNRMAFSPSLGLIILLPICRTPTSFLR